MEDLIQVLSMTLQLAQKRMRTAMKRELGDVAGERLRPIDFMAIRMLHRQPGLTIRQLSERIGISHSTVSSMMDRYERNGMVNKVVDERDRRAMRLYLRDETKPFIRRVLQPVMDRTVRDMVSRLSEVDQRALHQGAAALLRALEAFEEEDDRGEHAE